MILTHWENMKSEKEAYEYQIYLPGETVMNKADGVALFEPLEDEDWDVVTLQQVSSLAGIEESWSPFIEELTAYVRMTAPKAKVLIHQTWAYDKGTLNEGFSKYSNSTDTIREADQAERYVNRPRRLPRERSRMLPRGRVFL